MNYYSSLRIPWNSSDTVYLVGISVAARHGVIGITQPSNRHRRPPQAAMIRLLLIFTLTALLSAAYGKTTLRGSLFRGLSDASPEGEDIALQIMRIADLAVDWTPRDGSDIFSGKTGKPSPSSHPYTPHTYSRHITPTLKTVHSNTHTLQHYYTSHTPPSCRT